MTKGGYSLDPASERGMTEWAHRECGMTKGGYSLDPASECGMTEWAHRECGMTRQALQGIGEGIKKEPEGCLLLTSFRLIF